MALKYSVGDRVLAEGRPGTITGLYETDPEGVPFPYYVRLIDVGQTKLLFAESELEPLPDAGSDAVWEAMAYAYWEKWRATENQLDELKLKIRELIEDAFA